VYKHRCNKTETERHSLDIVQLQFDFTEMSSRAHFINKPGLDNPQIFQKRPNISFGVVEY